MLDGDLTTGALAVWRGAREPKCARVRHEDVSRDWEFGVDEAELQLRAAQLAGPAVVPRFATYADDDVETVIVVEEDIAGVTLRELIDALAHAGGEVPTGLVAYVGREIVRAIATAGDVALRFDPREIDVGWSGAVALRPLAEPRDVDELAWEEDGLRRIAYRASVDEPASRFAVLGAVLYEISAGRHPYSADGDVDHDGDVADEEERIASMIDRIERREFAELPAFPFSERLLRGEVERSDDAAAALDELREGFDASALAGMLRGLFPGRKGRDDDERDDRLRILPGPKVEPEEWKILDADLLGRDTAGYETVGLADVLADPVVRRGYARSLEPSVPPIDPFDDE